MKEQNPEGLGGWLILVGLGIVLSPIRIIAMVFPTYRDIFTNGSWEVLTTPGSEVYNPLWKPILAGELTINALLVAGWVFIGFLFFTRKRIFPKVYIGILVFTLVFIIADAFSIKSVLPNEPVFDPETIKEILRGAVAICIWVPYMLISKRVRATFVR